METDKTTATTAVRRLLLHVGKLPEADLGSTSLCAHPRLYVKTTSDRLPNCPQDFQVQALQKGHQVQGSARTTASAALEASPAASQPRVTLQQGAEKGNLAADER